MTVSILNTPEKRITRKILMILTALKDLPKTTVQSEEKDDIVTNISIQHAQAFVPDFHFEWSPTYLHFRVYIHVAHTTYEKVRAGYCICTIGSALAASGFVVLYNFLHKHRSNNRNSWMPILEKKYG